MHVWRLIVDAVGLLVLVVLVYGVALVVRRRLISRQGGTFELSHRDPGSAEGRGWVLGVGRYSGERLEWFRVFTLAPRPKHTWTRANLSYDGSRRPMGAEQTSLYPDHLVISCLDPSGRQVELAMGSGSLTGFQAWLEARPPGSDWSR